MINLRDTFKTVCCEKRVSPFRRRMAEVRTRAIYPPASESICSISQARICGMSEAWNPFVRFFNCKKDSATTNQRPKKARENALLSPTSVLPFFFFRSSPLLPPHTHTLLHLVVFHSSISVSSYRFDSVSRLHHCQIRFHLAEGKGQESG